LQGIVTQRLVVEVGDFVIRRADGLFAYHLAVVVDDAAQGVTDVVRGNDLLQSTPAQIYLQRVLRLPEPRYLHVPLVVDRAGQKLGKSTRAAAIDVQQPGPSLISALRYLNQPVPTDLMRTDVGSILSWATRHWEPLRIPTKEAICWR
jgi:glutamyl-Q tRNA(Asp) synthetase